MLPSFSSGLVALAVSFCGLASAQQYAGDYVNTSLPFVPGSEITFFKITDPTGKITNNMTLINYMSFNSSNQRPITSNIERAVIVVHGLDRDPGTYESNMLSALSQVSDPNVNEDTVAIMAPYFADGDDKGTGYPWTSGLASGCGSTSTALVWSGSQWSAGGNSQYPYCKANKINSQMSSYTVLDQLIQYFDNATIYPNMKQIVVAGHSLGGQTIQRYAALSQLKQRTPTTYWVGNPNSLIWFNTTRPLDTSTCSIYDVYREGYTNFTVYPMTYGTSLVASGRPAILTNYQSRGIAYGRGTQDTGDDSSTCAPFTTGANRNERFFNFIEAFPVSCSDPSGNDCDTVDLVNCGHDAGCMFAAPAGQARLFTDNFYGNGSRAYDFGYPREQAGDDPYPNPGLANDTASQDTTVYAGNMTYQGCWSDQTPASLNNLTYTGSANTIESCTSMCAQGGNTIAGLEDGNQCFCGTALQSKAVLVVESSCTTPCTGNSSEVCGGQNRLSLYSNGQPVVDPAPSNPEIVGNYFFSNCYTEATSGRALSAKSTSGSFMTLEYCANFCGNGVYQYFGVEYADECYCGNTLNAGSVVANAGDCDMVCPANNLELCGAGNRLSLYQLESGVTVSSSAASTTATGTATSSAAASTSSLSCPASNNTIYTAPSGQNFTIECGIDHQGGDMGSVTASTFAACVQACDSTTGCVDVSLSGVACYLKSSLGAAVSSPNIWGARLIASTAISSTVSAISSSSSVSSSQTTATTTSSSSSVSTVTSSSSVSASASSTTISSTTSSSSSSASASSTAISCPASNSTLFTAASGATYLIECGIDHQGGDLTSTSTNTLAACIAACDAQPGCVDVSMLGVGCYMKSSVGTAIANAQVNGAKLVTVSFSASSSTASSTASVAVNAVSTTSTSSSVSSSTASSSTLSTSTSTLSTSTVSSSTSTASSSTSTVSSSTSTISSSTSTVSSSTRTASSSTSTSSSSVASSTTSTSSTLSSSTSTVSLTTSSSSSVASTSTSTSSASSSTASSTSSSSSSSSSVASTTTFSTSTVSSTSSSTSTSSTAAALPSGFSSVGCFVDSTSARALTVENGSTSTNTPSQCASNCRGMGYKYSGTEYGSECWCGNYEPATAAAASDCNMKCSGDSTQNCGAGNRLSVVVDNTWVQKLFAVQSYSTWNLMSCYVDSTSSRTLPTGLSTFGGSSNATVENCLNACTTKGLTYCGLEYYSQCFAGSTAPTASVATSASGSTDPLAAGCAYPCNGNSSEACGGSNRILVYINNGASS